VCGLWRQSSELSIAERVEDADCTTLPPSDTYKTPVLSSEDRLFLNIVNPTKLHVGVWVHGYVYSLQRYIVGKGGG
jgi:carboxylesterase type B